MNRDSTMRKAGRKLASPARLAGYLRFKLVEGNEYLYHDLVDAAPAVASMLRVLPSRVDFDRPVFLAGLRRSGTTLFYRIMNAHPALFLYNERFPGDRMNGGGVSTDRNIWSIRDAEPFRDTVRRYLGPAVRRRRRWGVKLALELAHPDPGSVAVEGMEAVLRFFPQCRVAGIVRDPRDFVLSALKRGGQSLEFWIAEYRTMHELFVRMKDAYPDRFRIVRYEDLVQDTETTVRDCCTFFELPFLPAMLDPGSWSVKGPREYDSSRIVAQTAKWRSAEGEARLAIGRVVEACFPAAETLGYRREP